MIYGPSFRRLRKLLASCTLVTLLSTSRRRSYISAKTRRTHHANGMLTGLLFTPNYATHFHDYLHDYLPISTLWLPLQSGTISNLRLYS
jgi:hypothetical protein